MEREHQYVTDNTDPIGTISSSRLRELALYSGDPWQPSNEYFDRAEAHMEKLWSDRIWPFVRGCDFSSTVDLAAGKGRNSVKLIELCQALFVIDINKSLVEHCRARFSGRPNTTFAVGNGYDVTPVPDSWATLVYCFDAMVHFDSDVVRSYLMDLRRVLRPGGRAFLHHSNLTSETSDWRTNTCARNFMSLELLAHYARKEGLSIVGQETVEWGGHAKLDGFSLLENPL